MADEAGNNTRTTGGENELMVRLASVEELLRQQTRQTERLAKSRRVMAGLMAALVLVFAAGLLWLNTTVAAATREVPQLVQTTTASMRQLESALQTVGGLDVQAMNGTLQEMESGLAKVDFEALNQSITDLQKVVEGLSRFTSLFG